MRRKPSHLLTLVLLLGFLIQPGAAQKLGQEQNKPRSEAASAKAQPSETRMAALTNGDASAGLRIIISADSWLGEYVTYKSGENFIVVVPQAKTSAIRWNLAGRGLLEVHVEQRGEDAVLLFRVQSRARPHVQQTVNRLDVDFLALDLTPDNVDNVTSIGNETGVARSTSPAGSAAAAVPSAVAGQPTVPVSNSSTPAPQGLDLTKLTELFKANSSADALNLDLSVPESPAFTVLGLTPQTVVRPATPREFASSLLNGLDANGNFQNGLAIDTAPFMLFNGENVKIRDYMDQYLTRLLSRTQFSFAAVKGASKADLSTKLSLGLNLTLWDRGDPRIYRPGKEGDVLDCFVKNLDSTIPIPPSVDPDNQEQVQKFVAGEEARLKPLADKCRADGRKANWNRSSWTIAYAPSWISTTGNSSDFKWNGGAFWTSVAYGFEEVPSLSKLAQLIFHARYRTREQVADPLNSAKFLTQNSTFVGARFRAGSPKFAFNFEDAYIRTKPIGGQSNSSNRLSVGAELRLTDNLYFVISGGGNAGKVDGKNKGFVVTSFKYGFNKQSQLTPQPQ